MATYRAVCDAEVSSAYRSGDRSDLTIQVVLCYEVPLGYKLL